MAITTDTTIDVQIAGVTVDTIGISDTLDNYSIEEIASSGYCSMNHKLWVNGQTKTDGEHYTVSKTVPVTLSGASFPITIDKGTTDYNYPDGVYCAIVWVYSADMSPFDYVIKANNADHYRIVTEWNAPRYVYYPAPLQESGHWTSKTHLSWANNDITGYVWNNGYNNNFQTLYYWSDDEATDTVEVEHIRPYLLFVNENGSYFMVQYDYSYQATFFYADTDTYAATTTLKDYTDSENIAFCVGIETLGSPNELPKTTSNYYAFNTEGYTADGEFGVYFGTSSSAISGHSGYFAYSSEYAMCKKDRVFLDIAGNGLKFYTDKLYKPIISGGHVTGYTDDMDEESELDDWDGTANHGASPYPPAPPVDDDDNTDPISTAGAPYAKGLVNYYAMTAGSVLIDHIAEALSTWDLQNTGKDLFKNLVSCKLIKPPAAIPTTGSEPFTIYGEKPQYQGADITLPVVSGNPDATFGPYSISRKFNDFRDYAPYTRVSIYLPYCGWCDLPSHVVGRSVTVKYFTDIIAATVRAVVFCNNNIVAEAAGVMGLDIPFTADAVGMKQAGVVSGLTAYAGGALQTAAGVAQLVTSKDAKGLGNVFSGASKLLSAYTQTAEAFNENTTEISGKNGDGCSLSGATNIIIKIIRPKYGASSDPPYVPAGFAHAVGFVSNKQVRVGNVSGLLIADNVDTSGIAGATDAERAEIKRVLETGLIVNSPPES